MLVQRSRMVLLIGVLCLCQITCGTASAHADTQCDRKAWSFISNTGSILYLTAGVTLPLLEDGKSGRNHALRAADALGTSVLFADGFKLLVKE